MGENSVHFSIFGSDPQVCENSVHFSILGPTQKWAIIVYTSQFCALRNRALSVSKSVPSGFGRSHVYTERQREKDIFQICRLWGVVLGWWVCGGKVYKKVTESVRRVYAKGTRKVDDKSTQSVQQSSAGMQIVGTQIKLLYANGTKRVRNVYTNQVLVRNVYGKCTNMVRK